VLAVTGAIFLVVFGTLVYAAVLSSLQNIQERLAGEVPRAKAELAKHCTEITLTPEGESYKLSGEWNLVGEVRSGGAGGPNCM